MQIYFHSHLCSYLLRVPILVEGTIYIYIYIPFLFDFGTEYDHLFVRFTLLTKTISCSFLTFFYFIFFTIQDW